ncbi:SDR family NAD(P)-dependent oxidoreductase [Exiguobacterium oxidotolerans]|uniref:3-oxoacyl-(Acyl-carrier-protein) reductase FabG n=1 Tax=Exiguobacterium oxidotolerans TaxID=223958 RepID=A0A653IH86_9BACL|nr:SDR family NAD(P)-dependent oxidoreductase [Exiguobacterium oxidotolerans]VWX38637.1 3-oxoacyl-(acyl-carrier-protein) reductase FabG [Exiguobacterium oxidotolerans]
MKRLEEKITLITGAGSGMGEATTLAFAREGAIVIATDINEEAVRSVVKQIHLAGGQAYALHHDVASRASWKAVFEMVDREFSRLDVLVNNAGIALSTPFLEQDETDWARIFNINVNSVLLGMQQAVPMMENTGGSIVNIASISAISGMAGAGGYTASKGAVDAATRAAAVDYGKHNIRVNAVYPGYIETKMSAPSMATYKDYFEQVIPLGHVGNAEEVAHAVLFLATDEASHISGIGLPVDGGVTAR